MEYRVVASENFYDFQARVNEEINNGWSPCGGVSVGIAFDHHVARLVKLYTQAMTRMPRVGWNLTTILTDNSGAVVNLNETFEKELAR